MKKTKIKIHKYVKPKVGKPQFSWKLIASNGNVVASGSGLNKKPNAKYFKRLILILSNSF